MLLASLLFVTLIAAGVAMVVRAVRGDRAAAAKNPSVDALHILESRFTRGEIERDEFEERRSTLVG